MDNLQQEYTVLGDVLLLIKNNLLGVFFIISMFIEFAPLKINPISAAMEFLLKPIRGDVKEMKDDIDEKMDAVEKAIAEIKDDQDRNRFTTCRWEILTFASALNNNGQLFTAQEYLHIKEIIREYDELCERCNFENGYTNDAVEKINDHYDKYKDSGVKYF